MTLNGAAGKLLLPCALNNHSENVQCHKETMPLSPCKLRKMTIIFNKFISLLKLFITLVLLFFKTKELTLLGSG